MQDLADSSCHRVFGAGGVDGGTFIGGNADVNFDNEGAGVQWTKEGPHNYGSKTGIMYEFRPR
jgi:hypothetical protein